MKGECASLRTAIENLAHGVEDASALNHVQTCRPCQALLADLKRAIRALSLRHESAPHELIQRAKNVFPAAQTLPVRRIGFTLGHAGARGGSAVQASFEFEGGTARVQYQPTGTGIHVMARIEGSGWHSTPADIDAQGRVEFEAAEWDQTTIRLLKEGHEVVIEAPFEARDGS